VQAGLCNCCRVLWEIKRKKHEERTNAGPFNRKRLHFVQTCYSQPAQAVTDCAVIERYPLCSGPAKRSALDPGRQQDRTSALSRPKTPSSSLCMAQ